MKKIIMAACSIVLLISCQQNQAQKEVAEATTTENQTPMAKETIYQFKVKDLSGKEFDFASLKGKKILVVNTASKCGLTPQYKDLQALYDTYKGQNFVIVGFPANNFASQEPGTNAEIATFCEMNYGVTFPMMDKISVKGDDMAPIYKFLTQKSKNGVQDSEVEWNFQKYLINEQGELVKVISPKTLPTDKEIVDWVKS
ncbi:glutathione peroxidase [Flavobacterium kingsejongi]|uniref:Glutathione peroxidase n=1 Tax=Flavobacterium kingsejongi TaxID=1678728 RepID=A0A2S1LPV6_9FLAO|nr:glutathione peroxidase [Flavobacterium kingsejongi]AWG25676.1 glutathione peroxidase [Flavobacterium kingsejongi]